MFLLFYEMAVARFLFVEQSRPSLKDVSDLTREQLREYSVEENAATEDTWNRTVFGNGEQYANDSEAAYPWHRCSTNSECFDWVLNKEDPKVRDWI